MKIELQRTESGTQGTNSDLYIDGKLHSHAIELPWKDNQHGVSCIPPGTYKLSKHHSEKLGEVIEIDSVPNRSDILIHPANNALKELRGCIAPVMAFAGVGSGTGSRDAFLPLRNDVYRCLDAGEEVTIIIS